MGHHFQQLATRWHITCGSRNTGGTSLAALEARVGHHFQQLEAVAHYLCKGPVLLLDLAQPSGTSKVTLLEQHTCPVLLSWEFATVANPKPTVDNYLPHLLNHLLSETQPSAITWSEKGSKTPPRTFRTLQHILYITIAS